MRTTLTLEPDVAARLERIGRRQKIPFKAIVNTALRAGLDSLERPTEPRAFTTAGLDLGTSLVGSLDDVEGALARAEGESHR